MLQIKTKDRQKGPQSQLWEGKKEEKRQEKRCQKTVLPYNSDVHFTDVSNAAKTSLHEHKLTSVRN